jgi:hypothetical protein
MNLKKPECLPFNSLPVPKDDSIKAGTYIFSLEVNEGPLETDIVYELLTGYPLDRMNPIKQTRIARQVFQVVGQHAPNTRKYEPSKVLHSLERA